MEATPELHGSCCSLATARTVVKESSYSSGRNRFGYQDNHIAAKYGVDGAHNSKLHSLTGWQGHTSVPRSEAHLFLLSRKSDDGM